jgi:phasin family protein
MDTDQPAAKRRRKPAPDGPSVIEVAHAGPLPAVELPEPAADAAPEPAIPLAAIPTAAVPADLTEHTPMDTETVSGTADAARSQADAMMNDMSSRTGDAMQQGVKFTEELVAFNKGNLEAVMESSTIAFRGMETMGQTAAAYAKQSFEQGSQAWRQLASVKSPTEFMKLQGDLMRRSFDDLVAQGSRSTESMLKLAGEVAQPLSNRLAVAAEKVKVAA